MSLAVSRCSWRSSVSLPQRRTLRRRTLVVVRAQKDQRGAPPPPPPPPPPPLPQQDITFGEFKEKYLRPIWAPASFTLGALTLGVRTSAANFALDTDVSARWPNELQKA